MGVLEGIVIATIVIVGAYVGYHAWQESLGAPAGDLHLIDPELYVDLRAVEPHLRAPLPAGFH